MFLKFWIISTAICLMLHLSVIIRVHIDTKREFTKEEIKAYGKWKRTGKYAWYIYVLLLTCPIANILFVLAAGVGLENIREQIFADIRKANGKQTFSEKLSDTLEDLFK